MFSNKLRIVAIPAIALAMFAAACGSDSDGDSITSDTGGSASGTSEEAQVDARFMVNPNERLVFEGREYRLMTMFQRDLSADDGFGEAGNVESSTISTSNKVYRLDGHDFLFTLATVTDEANPDVPTWLQWELVQS